MNRVHVAALILLVPAFVAYFASWMPGAAGLFALGMLPEAAGWTVMWLGRNADPPRED